MSIVLLGSGGMLAADLEKVMAGGEVVALDKNEVDITDYKKLKEMVLSINPEVIINAAAYTDVDGAEDNKEEVFRVNHEGVENVARVASLLDATIVHFSTDYVFPGDDKNGYKEEASPGPPVNVYGESKLKGEESLARVGGKYYILRTAWLYGKEGSNFVKTMLRMSEDNNTPRVVNDQYGCPTYTKDVAEATKKLLAGEYKYGIYHVVNEGVTTWRGLAEEIFRLTGVGVKIEPVGSEEYLRPARRPRYSVLLNTRGPKMRSWQEALSDFIENSYKAGT